MKNAGQKLRKLTTCAVFAAFICVLAPFSIPTAGVPVTLATLAVYVAAGCLSPGMSAAAVAVYLAVGALGAPVFSGFSGGAARFVSPTGGYLVGYLPTAAAASALIWLWDRRKGSRGRFAELADVGVRAGAMVAGTAILYALGTAWFVYSQETTVSAALSLCVLPFLPGDAAKIAVAAIASNRLRRFVR